MRFIRDERGVIAVEAALVMPVVALLMFGATDIFIAYSAQTATTSAATACASISGRMLKQQPGDVGRAKSAADATMRGNKDTFGLTGTMALASKDALDFNGQPTTDDTQAVAFRCVISNSTQIPLPLFGIFSNPFLTSASVQS